MDWDDNQKRIGFGDESVTASDRGVGSESEQILAGKGKGQWWRDWDPNGILQSARGTLHTEDTDE